MYSSKTDIWSIGIMYYEMLFGVTPWTAQTEEELLSNIYRIKISFPNHIQISNDSRNFILKCLQIEEKNRISWSEITNHSLFENETKIYDTPSLLKYGKNHRLNSYG
jgi:calcium-dependent protein kinase